MRLNLTKLFVVIFVDILSSLIVTYILSISIITVLSKPQPAKRIIPLKECLYNETSMKDKTLFKLTDAADASVAGGKASALGAMLRAGFQVPNGFVVSANAFKAMTAELENMLLRAFDDLGASFVAVRSSAVNEDSTDAAWAGQLDTFLSCSRKELLQKVKSCWKSVDTARAQSYALQKGIKSTAVAVLVQEMIDSDVSGIAFSVHPVTGDETHVVIEAGLGLGEAVVSGQITPDTYIVNKRNGQPVEKHVATQRKMLARNADGKNAWQDIGAKGNLQKLTELQIAEVCGLTRKLEAFFNYPIDMEWAIKDNMLYILQCRPITTLTHK